MKHLFLSVAFTGALLAVSTSTFASLELAQKSACMACHGVENKVLGPAYKAVAEKYKGKKDAEASLVTSIKKGGSGKWGSIPMPAQANLSDADAKTLAKWILSTAK
ncbi:MAG: c-type cytochrome [Burkholderiaceae bacterium]